MGGALCQQRWEELRGGQTPVCAQGGLAHCLDIPGAEGRLPCMCACVCMCACACGGGGGLGGELELMARSGCVQFLIPQPFQALLGYRGGPRAQPRPCQPCREALILELSPHLRGREGRAPCPCSSHAGLSLPRGRLSFHSGLCLSASLSGLPAQTTLLCRSPLSLSWSICHHPSAKMVSASFL